jgi:hypothetical protein
MTNDDFYSLSSRARSIANATINSIGGSDDKGFDISSQTGDTDRGRFFAIIKKRQDGKLVPFTSDFGSIVYNIVDRAIDSCLAGSDRSVNTSTWLRENFRMNEVEVGRIKRIFTTPSTEYSTGGVKSLTERYVKRGLRDGRSIATEALERSGISKDTLDAYRSPLYSSYSGTLINWHLNSRFPFARSKNIMLNGVSIVDEYDAEFDYPGEMPYISEFPDRKEFPNPEFDYPYGVNAPSPTLTERLNRIANIACEELQERLSVDSRKFRWYEEGGKLKSVGEIQEAKRNMTDAVLRNVALKVNGWANRLLKSEKLRAMQFSQLYYYRYLGVRWFKWVTLSSHSRNLGNYGMFRDWCDDLAQTPIGLTIKNSADRKYLESIAHLIPTDSYVKDSDAPVRYLDQIVTVRITNPLMGIYPTTAVTRKMVPALVHKWVMVRGKQHITGRVFKVIRIPPHPYCSCLMLPVINPEDPKESLRHDLSIIERLAAEVGETRALDLGHSVAKAMLEGADYTDLYMLFLEFFAPDTAKILATEAEVSGPDTFILSPSEIGIQELKFAA